MRYKSIPLLLAFLALLFPGCEKKVATQFIPVSTYPREARVSIDGVPACNTPCQVELTRTQDHILSVEKQGYRPQDVFVKRQFQSEKSLLSAINSGLNTARFFKDPMMGISSGLQSLKSAEESGEAYVLLPTTVSLNLIPLAGYPAKTAPDMADKAISSGVCPLDMMNKDDEAMLENILANYPTGQTAAWTNKISGISFAVSAEDAKIEEGRVIRWFTIVAKLGENQAAGRYPANRTGREEWQVGMPSTAPQSPTPSGQAPKTDYKYITRSLAEAPWPSEKHEWKITSSESSKTNVNPDGSVTKTTQKTQVKAGVNVSPAAVSGLLGAIMDLVGKDDRK